MDAKHILLIEDDPVLGRLLVRILGHRAWTVVLAPTGEAGIHHLAHQRFDLVITDVNLPGCNGFAVLQAARLHVPPPPVVLMTGGGTVLDRQTAVAQGARDCLFKPFPIPVFLARVASYFEPAPPAAQPP